MDKHWTLTIPWCATQQLGIIAGEKCLTFASLFHCSSLACSWCWSWLSCSLRWSLSSSASAALVCSVAIVFCIRLSSSCDSPALKKSTQRKHYWRTYIERNTGQENCFCLVMFPSPSKAPNKTVDAPMLRDKGGTTELHHESFMWTISLFVIFIW